MGTTRIVCIGPVYVDVNFIDFPSDDGMPVEQEMIGGRYEVVPGGSSANFARFGRSLGLRTALASGVGTDVFGTALTAMLSESGVESLLCADGGAQTPLGLNFVAPNGKTVMAVAGTIGGGLEESRVRALVDRESEGMTHLYLGGSFKLGHLLPLFTEVAHGLRQQGVTVVLDHGRVPAGVSSTVLAQMKDLVAAVGVYFPSHGEFLRLWGGDDPHATAERVVDQVDRSDFTLVLKDGDHGATAYTVGECVSATAYQVSAENTVGAGDSFNAGFIAAGTLDLSLKERLDFASATAAMKISTSDPLTVQNVQRFRRAHREGCTVTSRGLPASQSR